MVHTMISARLMEATPDYSASEPWRKAGLTSERVVGRMRMMNPGALSVENNIRESEIEETGLDEDGAELNLGTVSPIIVGKKTLMEMATLSLTIAEDMIS
jgi:hypothetical protein